MQGDIEQEKLNSHLLEIQNQHQRADASTDGAAEAERAEAFLKGLETEVRGSFFLGARRVWVGLAPLVSQPFSSRASHPPRAAIHGSRIVPRPFAAFFSAHPHHGAFYRTRVLCSSTRPRSWLAAPAPPRPSWMR